MSKKQELLINAAKIIHEQGIQHFTMEALAEKSGITKGGVLYHFESKSALLVKMNELAIEQFEEKITTYLTQLDGRYMFTRAYGLATIDYIQDKQNILLPAVFITSLEEKKCKALWDETIRKWDVRFSEDAGDQNKILKFRLICDGIWFSITYDFDADIIQAVTKLLKNECDQLASDK